MPTRQYYIRTRGKVLGPFSVEQLKSLHHRGQFGRFHEISEDRRTWSAAATLEEVFSPSPTSPANPIADLGYAMERTATRVEAAVPTAGRAVTWYYWDAAANQPVPFSPDQVPALLKAGTIDPSTMVMNEQMATWLSLEQTELATGTRGAAAGVGSRSPTSRGHEAAGWRKVQAGLGLIVVETFLWLGIGIVGAVAFLISAGGGRTVAGLAVTSYLLLLLYFGAQIIELIGFALCGGSPAARGLAIGNLVAAIAKGALNVLLPILLLVVGGTDAFAGSGLPPRICAGLIALLMATNPLLFSLYLRSMAQRLGAPSLSQSTLYLTVYYLIFLLLTLFFGVIFGVVHFGLPSSERTALGLWIAFGVVLGMMGLVWVIWFLVVLLQARRALANTRGN